MILIFNLFSHSNRSDAVLIDNRLEKQEVNYSNKVKGRGHSQSSGNENKDLRRGIW